MPARRQRVARTLVWAVLGVAVVLLAAVWLWCERLEPLARSNAQTEQELERACGDRFSRPTTPPAPMAEPPVRAATDDSDEFDLRRYEEALSDESAYHTGSLRYAEARPRTPEEVQIALAWAHRTGRPVRFRGRGHSLSGASLPERGELVVFSSALREYRFEAEGTLWVGAGVSLDELNQFLQARGYRLPVVNEGGDGPSVGGFIAAGGLGPDSDRHGGFWEQVVRVRLVDGTGRLYEISRDDRTFPWLFGSMGQLGFFVEAELRILPVDDVPPPYPEGETGTVPSPKVEAAVDVDEWLRRREETAVFWFQILAPTGDAETARTRLDDLTLRFSDLAARTWSPTYEVRASGSWVPPLIHPKQEDLAVVAQYFYLDREAVEDTWPQLLEFERAFQAVVAEEPEWTRYVQAEVVDPERSYAAYFTRETYCSFAALKRHFDPAHILGRGVVFPYSGSDGDRRGGERE